MLSSKSLPQCFNFYPHSTLHFDFSDGEGKGKRKQKDKGKKKTYTLYVRRPEKKTKRM